MKKQLIIGFAALLLFSPRANAHRLNEYLQATQISLAEDSIGFHINLTPGTGIAQQILTSVDLNGDGVLSYSEQALYTSTVLRNIALLLDGKPAILKTVSFNFPAVEEIKNGTGDIKLNLSALLEAGKQTHQLILKNQQPGTVVYLVNCLLPSGGNIRVTGQARNSDQSVYTLDFTAENALHTATTKEQAAAAKQDNLPVVKTYFFHGIQHILTGYDHLLFLCALVLGAAGIWDLIKIITAFTIAHSVTLTLAVLGWVQVPGYVVEPLIAASIVYVAIQNIFWPQYAHGRSRIYAAFLFGLFHGLGFAGGLLALMHALPVQTLLYAIVGFSLGIEAGNQLVLLPLYTLLLGAKRYSRSQFAMKRLHTIRLFVSGLVAAGGSWYLVNAVCS